jgi:uncharacterized protein (TIGR00369 family)
LTASLDAIRQFFDEIIPFNKLVGIELVDLERGKLSAKIPFRPELIGDPTRPALHGGVISTLADTVGGGAVFTLTNAGDKVATIDLRVDYLLPGKPADLFAEATVIRVGNRVGVASIEVTQEGTEGPIAVAKGVYTIKRAGD